ncbi:MAG TPA: methylenetetrahydrofolate reductase [Burkholderiales bacterium]|nr:methylenetetrahydrofolate reductase [Burkholderiales bacterium]
MTAALTESARASANAGIAACAAELVAAGCLEIGIEARAEIPAIASLLPVGARVYVNHSPRHALADALPALAALHDAGLDPVPHIAARRVLSRGEVRAFLEQATAQCGVSRVLLVGGDDPQPRGPYDSGAALLRDGLLAQSDVREIGVPGYPEGHPRIEAAVLAQALREKLSLATAQGLGFHMVTQFSFAPARVIEHCAMLARELPGLPLYVGMAGPTSAATLLRFAQRCGVSASLRALKDQGMATVKLVTHTDPGEQLAAVAHYCAAHASCNVVGVHVFSFGGATRSAAWMAKAIADGAAPRETA